jgi:hypothetical protein
VSVAAHHDSDEAKRRVAERVVLQVLSWPLPRQTRQQSHMPLGRRGRTRNCVHSRATEGQEKGALLAARCSLSYCSHRRNALLVCAFLLQRESKPSVSAQMNSEILTNTQRFAGILNGPIAARFGLAVVRAPSSQHARMHVTSMHSLPTDC